MSIHIPSMTRPRGLAPEHLLQKCGVYVIGDNDTHDDL